MNRLTQILLMVSALVITTQACADDRWETLRAINWVENPSNHTRKGRFGELGPYQFRPTTWRMHTSRPFSQATLREAADEVAVKHYEWIKTSLERAGVHPSPFNIAMAWNTGVNNVLKGRVPNVTYNYAERVSNLVETFKQRTASVPVAPIVTHAPVPSASVQFSLERPVVRFAVFSQDAPKFEIAVAPAPEIPVVYTDRSYPRPEPVLVAAAQADHRFTVSTTATLTPRFNLLPTLLE
jgi:hypothetical protein